MKQLPEAQLEVMLVIWGEEGPITRSEIQSRLPENQWKTTTLNTFLNRLSNSGYLKIEHRKKEYLYTPLVTKEEYMAFAGRNVLKNLYDNSIKKFVAAVCNSSDMMDSEVEELEELLAKLKEGDRCD